MSTAKVLDLDAIKNRRASKQVHPVLLSDGTTAYVKNMKGSEYREWERLLRNEDGTTNKERFDMREDIFLAFSLCDAEGNLLLSPSQVYDDHMLDNFDLCDLDALRNKADEINSRKSIGHMGNDSSKTSSSG